MRHKSKRVYAVRKPNHLTSFPLNIWDNLGKDKNGWEEITEEQYDELTSVRTSDTSAAQADLAAEMLKRKAAKLAEAADSFGATEDETEKAQAALVEIDPTQPLSKTELVKLADAAYSTKDYESSLQYFLKAQALGSTKYIDSKIKACNKKLGYED